MVLQTNLFSMLSSFTSDLKQRYFLGGKSFTRTQKKSLILAQKELSYMLYTCKLSIDFEEFGQRKKKLAIGSLSSLGGENT